MKTIDVSGISNCTLYDKTTMVAQELELYANTFGAKDIIAPHSIVAMLEILREFKFTKTFDKIIELHDTTVRFIGRLARIYPWDSKSRAKFKIYALVDIRTDIIRMYNGYDCMEVKVIWS